MTSKTHNQKTGRVLVIDDDSGIAEIVAISARDMGLVCVVTTEGSDIPDLLTSDTTLILLDLLMPKMDGIEVLRLLSAQKCTAGIVLMSGIGERVIETAERLAKALGLCVVGHLQKPFRLTELEDLLRRFAGTKTTPEPRKRAQITFDDSELRSAIERDEFVLHYQPQIDIDTGAVAGLEALVRWQHPRQGLIYPDSFLARTESLGLIVQLGWLTIERGLAELHHFGGKNGILPRLSINITVHSLLDLTFPDHFISLARKHHIPPTSVTVEITESGILKELASTLDVLTRLRMKQVNLSIDDFGTGYAMMQQLRTVPATELKIDMSFIQNMHANTGDRVIVEKTIEMGHELGLQVVAEGVETEQQLSFLRKKGCDIAQGYLSSRPLPPVEMTKWLAAHRSGVMQ